MFQKNKHHRSYRHWKELVHFQRDWGSGEFEGEDTFITTIGIDIRDSCYVPVEAVSSIGQSFGELMLFPTS